MLNVSSQSVHDLFTRAIALHQAGQLAEAESLYRQILALDPRHADALHLMGVLACQSGHDRAAIELIAKAIAVNPAHPAYHSNLGEALRKTGDLPRAQGSLRRAIALDARFADAYTNLAVILLQEDRAREAVELLENCVRHAPANANAWRLLGDALSKDGRTAQSLAAYDRALQINPQLLEARFNRGAALQAMGRPAQAAEAFATVLAAAPDDHQARFMLADALFCAGKLDDALAQFQRLVQTQPESAPAHAGVANVLRAGDRLDEAIAAYRRALALQPDHAITRANLAFALRDQARFDEARSLLRQALAEQPASAAIHSGLIFTLHLDPRISPELIDQEKDQWNQRHAAPLRATHRPHENRRDPHRRLRIGYLSADFRQHPVGRFMLPLLTHHNRAQVEVFCYSSTSSPDDFTARLQGAADHWRPLLSLSDDAAADLIRADAIDILVDLCNHTIGNRLLIFARKPAPVQITYLAYNAGTGLREMDWRLTDPFIDPPASGSDAPGERPLRLAETCWCYAPPDDAPECGPLPAETTTAAGQGTLTFGSFNYSSKVHDGVLELWAHLLQSLERSRLIMHAAQGSRQDHVHTFFANRGIAPTRIELVPRVSTRQYFAQYQRVDLALDPFPWAGGTTTCDALFMGVPVITLAGRPPHETLSRGGASLLTNLSLTHLIAHSPAQYISRAKQLAEDLSSLSHLRATLRTRMQSSPLMDAPRFARSVESAFRQAWARWVG